jgi:N-formylglutamate amidohydrolase
MTPFNPHADAHALGMSTPDVCEPELRPALEIIHQGGAPSPLVISSPHSGCIYSRHFLSLSRLDPKALRRSEDVDVDKLFTPAAQQCGAPLLKAHFPRAYVDVNREPYELDPSMFDGPLPSFVNTRSVRVSAGLGTIARLVDEGMPIYARPLPLSEIDRRLSAFYVPYHQALHDLIKTAHNAYGQSLLLDCHSMPSAPATRSDHTSKADIVLGDRYGTSCDPDITALIESALRHCGYDVQRNTPYAGGFITQHYGAPARARHALQIEINRALYMDERHFELLPHASALADDLSFACTQALAYFDGQRLYEAAE